MKKKGVISPRAPHFPGLHIPTSILFLIRIPDPVTFRRTTGTFEDEQWRTGVTSRSLLATHQNCQTLRVLSSESMADCSTSSRRVEVYVDIRQAWKHCSAMGCNVAE